MSEFKTDLAQNIFKFKYANHPEQTWADKCQNIVDDVMGGLVTDDEKQQMKKYIEEKKFLPGGRYIYYGGKIATFYNNCSLLRGEEDTREEWASLMERSTSWLMTGAGIGVDYSVFRPAGSYLNRTGGEASGPIPLMHAINEIGRNVKQGGSRRCLPEGSFVHTKRGLVRIEDVEENRDEALTYDGYRKVKNKFYQGEQELLTIYTQTGSFECTPNHKMAVLTSVYGDYKWTRAEDLQEGDRLLHTTSVIPGLKTTLPQSSYVRPERAYTAKPIQIPELDEDMAWFIGYYHANGHSAIRYQEGSKGKRNSVISVSIPNTAPQVVEKCHEQLSRFGVNVRIKDGYGACQLVKATSVELALWMAEHIKTSNEEFDVPDFILNGTAGLRAAYVAGVMDGDGSVSNRPIQIMSCIHEGYLQQLQTVCSSLGVATRVKMNRPAQGNWKPLYQLNLKGTKQEKQFNSTAGRYLIYKTEPPRVRKSEQFSYSLPAGMLKTSLPEHRVGYHRNHKVNCPIDLWEEMSGVSCSFTPVQVISVEQGGVSETWDIEVEDRHEFYCNGLLTHNSAIYASLNWQHDDAEAFLRAKNWHEMPVGHTGYTLWDAKQDNFDFPAPLDMTNISLNYDDEFLNQIKTGKLPTTFVENCRQALSTAEPGFSFNFGEKENETLRNACTEVCSEDDSDVCNLGSVNLGVIDSLEELKDVVRLASEFLVCGTLKAQLPYDKVYRVREKNRRLGLGLMGIHEWLLKRSYPYEVTPELHSWLHNYKVHSEDAANQLCDKLGISRPVAYRAIAPTGTIGILSSTSTGIEPLYAVAYKRRYLQGNNWKYEYVVDNTAKIMIDEYGVDPNDIETAADLATNPEKRIRFQADVQDYVDMAISSTINLPSWGSEHNNEDTLPEFAKTLSKYAPRLRGFTCYPDGARGGQPITTVDYHEALHHQGTVFEENQESQCRSGICGI